MKFFKKRHSLKGFLFVIFIVLTSAAILKLIDSRILPAADETAANYSAALINKKIDETAEDIMSEKKFKIHRLLHNNPKGRRNFRRRNKFRSGK
ncbi:MAG: hypothetical protein LUH47_06390 [Clostridiales bacterium]|nr:hypothetical protein [Clostridiales bacterium]